MTQEQLINYYEKQLEKVKEFYNGDCRKVAYIEQAKKDLEAVKNGRKW